MSLARYLSKLGALINSDGKVPSGALASGAARANFGAGAVLQVVEGVTYVVTTTSSSTFIDTGLSSTITPSSASSKILVFVSHSIAKHSANTYVGLQLMRNGTLVNFINDLIAYNNAAGFATDCVTSSFLDSPSTTSAVTYKTQFNNGAGSGIAIANADAGSDFERGRGSIILMEIAA